jgi:hypothetical protein
VTFSKRSNVSTVPLQSNNKYEHWYIKMIVIESVPFVSGSLIVSKGRCVLQVIEDAIITEYKIAVLFDDGEPLDVAFEWVVHPRGPLKIYQDLIDFGTIVYKGTPSVNVLETELPGLSCVCDIPVQWPEGPVTIQVGNGKFAIGNAIVPTFYARDSSSVEINGMYIPRGLCKVYICSSDTPVAFETGDRIVYVAPIIM